MLEALQYTGSFLLYKSLLKKKKYSGTLIKIALIVKVLTSRGKKIIVGDLKRSQPRVGPEVKAAVHNRIIERAEGKSRFKSLVEPYRGMI